MTDNKATRALKDFFEEMGVDLSVGIWNGQLVERIKDEDTDADDVRLALNKLWNDLSLIPDIVYCKECKHRYVDACYFMDDDVDDYGFCHHGERKEE